MQKTIIILLCIVCVVVLLIAYKMIQNRDWKIQQLIKVLKYQSTGDIVGLFTNDHTFIDSNDEVLRYHISKLFAERFVNRITDTEGRISFEHLSEIQNTISKTFSMGKDRVAHKFFTQCIDETIYFLCKYRFEELATTFFESIAMHSSKDIRIRVLNTLSSEKQARFTIAVNNKINAYIERASVKLEEIEYLKENRLAIAKKETVILVS